MSNYNALDRLDYTTKTLVKSLETARTAQPNSYSRNKELSLSYTCSSANLQTYLQQCELAEELRTLLDTARASALRDIVVRVLGYVARPGQQREGEGVCLVP